jgi:hypothetical protein
VEDGEDMKNNDCGMKVVKCACGLPMRQKNWADHWRTCYKGSSVPVRDSDVSALLASEDMQRKDAEEHAEWLRSRNSEAYAEWLRDRNIAVDSARSNVRVSI